MISTAALPFLLLAGVEFFAEVNAITPPAVDGVFNVYTKYGLAGLSLLVSLGLIWLVSKLSDRLMAQSENDRDIRKIEAKNHAELVSTLKDLVRELRQRTVLIKNYQVQYQFHMSLLKVYKYDYRNKKIHISYKWYAL